MTPRKSLIGPGRNRVVRPIDLRHQYVQPNVALSRMAAEGLIQRVAHGYYLVPPDNAEANWKPPFEHLAAGIGVADYGGANVTIWGISAARALGALPRSVAATQVGIPSRRGKLKTNFGYIHWRRVQVPQIDVRRFDSEVVRTFLTTPTQTVIDLATVVAIPVSPSTIAEAIRNLALQVDWDRAALLAATQRKTASLYRASWVAFQVCDVPKLPRPHDGVPALGLLGPKEHTTRFGIIANDR